MEFETVRSRQDGSRLFRVEAERFEAVWRSRRSGQRSPADSLRAETLVSTLGRRKEVGSSCFRISSALCSLSDTRRPCWGGEAEKFEAGWFEAVLRFEAEWFEAF